MTCSDMQCIPGDQDFTFRLAGLSTADAGRPDTVPADSAKTAETKTAKKVRNNGYRSWSASRDHPMR